MRKHLLIILGLAVALPLLVWVVAPIIPVLSEDRLLDTKQKIVGMPWVFAAIRLLVYSALVYVMPLRFGLSGESASAARRYSILMVIAVEIIIVQRLWLV